MRHLSLLCLLLVAASAAPARAGDRNEVSIGSWTRSLRSSSANAVTDDNLVGGALTYARELPFGLSPALAVWATSSFTWAAAEGTMFRTLTTDLDVLGLAAGARARYLLHSRIAVAARVDVGAAHTALRLEDAMGHTARGSRWGATGTAAVGLDLLAIVGTRLSLGLRAELGYTAALTPALTAEPGEGDGDDDAILLPRREASLGHLDLGGRFFGISAVGRF
jgi:hypothetical protein